MNSKFVEFLNALTEDELKELGAAFFGQPLLRVWTLLEGANAARDTPDRGEVFQSYYADHLFTMLTEDIGSRVAARVTPVGLTPGASVVPILKACATRQLQAERRNEEQMR